MPKDSPDFTRAGCTVSFLGGQVLGPTGKLQWTHITLTTASGTTDWLVTKTASIYVFLWGISKCAPGQAGVLTMLGAFGAVIAGYDTINLANESASSRPQGMKVANPQLRWTGVTPHSLNVQAFMVYATA